LSLKENVQACEVLDFLGLKKFCTKINFWVALGTKSEKKFF